MPQTFKLGNAFSWESIQTLPAHGYICAHCDHKVSSNKGYAYHAGSRKVGAVMVCPQCNSPSFFPPFSDEPMPSSKLGSSVRHLPEKVESLYEEARSCTSTSCFTGAVLLMRKLLMNIAVSQGADEGLSFIKYIDYPSELGFIPPNGRHWVDHIRKKGNEATHEIIAMSADDAKDLLMFIEMLLRFIYEFPSSIPPPAPPG